MTIKSTTVKNVQNVEEAHLIFDNRINVISGESENGKSTIFNSIIRTIKNKIRINDKKVISGYNYKPHNLKRGGISSSEVVFDNCKVRRDRNNSINKYILDDKEPAFEAFGTDVPPQINTLMNIPEYAIHTQFSGFFLLNDSAGSVAKQINEICDLSIIHESSAKIDSIVSEAKTDLKYTNGILEEKQEELETYNYVDEFERATEELECLLSENSALVVDIMVLETTLEDIKSLEVTIKENEKILELEPEINLLIQEIKLYNELSSDYELLNNDYDSINLLNSKILSNNKKITKEEDIKSLIQEINQYNLLNSDYQKLSKIIKDIESILSNGVDTSKLELEPEILKTIIMVEDYLLLEKNKNKLEKIYLSLKGYTDKTVELNEKIDNLQKKRDDFYATLKECPTCGNKLK